jgi:polar amino acid transport system substrate-binding protein
MTHQYSTTARQKIVDFVTYFNSSRAFLFRKGTLPTVKTEIDLCGLKVGLPAGTTMATAIVGLSTNCTTAGKAAIAYAIYPDQATTVLAVRSGRADLTILSAHVSSWWQQNAGDELEIVLRPDQGNDINGMVVRKGGLVNVMQKAVQQLMNDGSFKTIFAKWNIEKLMRAKAEINLSTR